MTGLRLVEHNKPVRLSGPEIHALTVERVEKWKTAREARKARRRIEFLRWVAPYAVVSVASIGAGLCVAWLIAAATR